MIATKIVFVVRCDTCKETCGAEYEYHFEHAEDARVVTEGEYGEFEGNRFTCNSCKSDREIQAANKDAEQAP